jgi:Domain of unknown function (DUF5668)
MGPVIVVTVGVLFLLQEMRSGFFDFGNTWPVILIVIGLLNLASAFASSEGHLPSSAAVPPAVPPPPGAPPSRSGATPTSYPGQGQ